MTAGIGARLDCGQTSFDNSEIEVEGQPVSAEYSVGHTADFDDQVGESLWAASIRLCAPPRETFLFEPVVKKSDKDNAPALAVPKPIETLEVAVLAVLRAQAVDRRGYCKRGVGAHLVEVFSLIGFELAW